MSHGPIDSISLETWRCELVCFTKLYAVHTHNVTTQWLYIQYTYHLKAIFLLIRSLFRLAGCVCVSVCIVSFRLLIQFSDCECLYRPGKARLCVAFVRSLHSIEIKSLVTMLLRLHCVWRHLFRWFLLLSHGGFLGRRHSRIDIVFKTCYGAMRAAFNIPLILTLLLAFRSSSEMRKQMCLLYGLYS